MPEPPPGEPSVYRNFRWLMVFCFWCGQFPVANVAASSARSVRFKPLSASTLVFALTHSYMVRVEWETLAVNGFQDGARKAYLLASACCWSLLKLWLLYGARSVAEGFLLVDRLRHARALIPGPPGTSSEPAIFSKLVLALCVAFHARVLILPLVFFRLNISFAVVQFFSTSFPIRSSFMLGCLFYGAYLAVGDLMGRWRTYALGNFYPPSQVDVVCEFAGTMTSLTGELGDKLSSQLLAVILYRICHSIARLLTLHAVTGTAYLFIGIELVTWSISIGLMVFSLYSLNEQIQTLIQDILELPTRDLSKRQALKLRSLICHLSSPGRSTFTAGGFIDVNPALFFYLLVLSVECYITFAQNQQSTASISNYASNNTHN